MEIKVIDLALLVITNSVTRLGDFLQFLVSNYRSKVAQMFGDFCSMLKTSLFK